MVHPSLQARLSRIWLALANAKNRQMNYASAGVGSAIFLAMGIIQDTTKSMWCTCHTKAGPAMTDVIGGQVPLMFIAISPSPPSSWTVCGTGQQQRQTSRCAARGARLRRAVIRASITPIGMA